MKKNTIVFDLPPDNPVSTRHAIEGVTEVGLDVLQITRSRLSGVSPSVSRVCQAARTAMLIASRLLPDRPRLQIQ